MRHDVACDLAGQLPHSLTLSHDTLSAAAPVGLRCKGLGMLWDSHYFLPGSAVEKSNVQVGLVKRPLSTDAVLLVA